VARHRNRVILRAADGYVWFARHPLTATGNSPEEARAAYEALLARLAADGLEPVSALPPPRASVEHGNMWAGQHRFGQPEPVGIRRRA
jgi:hypothetical protein